MNAILARPAAGTTARATIASSEAAPSEPLDALDLLDRIDCIASHWRCIGESLREIHKHHATAHPIALAPLPGWAVERLNDQGRVQSTDEEYRQHRNMLVELIRLGTGSDVNQRFEVWETANGNRLSIGHESWDAADSALTRLKERFPHAVIIRAHVHTGRRSATDPALLDTMIGSLFHCSTTFRCCGEDGHGDRVEIQDETGRTVEIPASTAEAHPSFSRINAQGRRAIAHSVERAAQRRGEAGGGL